MRLGQCARIQGLFGEYMAIDMKMKVSNLLLVCILCVMPCTASSNSSLEMSARRTGVRFLCLAEKYCDAKDFKTASNIADMGMGYCSDISDLWYIKAFCASELGNARAEVLPMVERSLKEGSWVDYNKDKARVLYADILCDVGRWNEAVSVLDDAPYIYSADAEFIRAKSYYRQGDISAARRKVDDSRKMYPDDTRFPLLFFRYERAINDSGDSGYAHQIADAFVARIASYKDCGDELFLFAAMASSGEHKKLMLKSFMEKEMRHPLFALAAMQEGLLSAKDAVEYFFWLADDTISMRYMTEFLSAVYGMDDDAANEAVKAHLLSYSGLIAADTTGDDEPNIFIKYSNSKISAINYDANNDGVNEWVAKCDDNAVISLELGGFGKRLKTEVGYGIYPSVTSVTLVTGKVVSFALVEDTYLWSPFEIEAEDEWQKDYGVQFLVPNALKDIPPLDIDALVRAAWKCTMPIDEREGATVTYTMLDGLRKTSEYFSDGKVYARGAYIDGLPSFRVVDGDGDGVFETTERYSRVKNTRVAQQSEEEPFTDDVYVSSVEVDLDEDTVPDFIEEYTEYGGKISTWDQDFDGQWDVRYEKQTNPDGLTEEKAYFFVPPRRDAVCVESINGEPREVTIGEYSSLVTKGGIEGMYWIGEAGEESDEAFAALKMQEISQGISILMEHGGKRIFAVRVGGKCYAFIVRDDNQNEKK